MIRRLSAAVLGTLLVITMITPSNAQIAIGGSYEIRNEVPKTGYGARIEKGIKLPVPLVDLGIRVSGSYFSKENQLEVTRQGVQYTYDKNVTSIDYGVTVLGKLKLGMVKPYVGVGIGGTKNNLRIDDIKAPNAQNVNPNALDPEEFDRSKLNYHGIIGGEFALIPLLNPFIEYRVNDYTGTMSIKETKTQFQESISESNGRLMFGVMLRF